MASIISASASDHGEGMLALEERRQQRQQIINGELKAKSAEPPVTNAIHQQQQRKAVILSTNDVQRGEKRGNPANAEAGNHDCKKQIARKVSVDCIEILDDDDDIEALGQNKPPQLQQQQLAIIEMDDDDEIRVIEEPIPPPKRAKFDGIHQALQREQRQPQQAEHSPVPEDPKNSTVESSKCPPHPQIGLSLITTNAVQNTAGSSAIQANQLKETSTTKTKTDEVEEVASTNSSPAKSSAQLINYDTLLDRLEEYVHTAIENGQNVDRKVLDALLAAINIQVQREPYSVRKLILDKQLVLPNTISFPPSQVVDMIVEHDPDHQLTRVINRIFGEERPKLSENERRERQQLKAQNPASNMTRVLLEIGQDLVQESTYFDIVHARNLPEQPRNMETYKQVAAQLKPVWQALKTKNLPHKLKTLTCQVCGFKTDSKIALTSHKQMLHFVGRRYQCTYCPEFDTNEYRITQHILEEHGIKPINPSDLDGDYNNGQIHCPICDENFHYKVQRDQHLKMCRRDLYKLHSIQAGRYPLDINAINRWLWDKPQIEPSVLNQQESQQRQQQIRQQQILLQQQKQTQTKVAAILAAHSSRTAIRANTNQQRGTIGMGIGGISQQRGAGNQQQQRMTQSQSSRSMTILPQQTTSTKLNNMLQARSGTGPIPAMSSMLTAAGGALQNSALSARMGLPPPNGQQQQKQQQISTANSKNLGAALAAMGFTGSKQPSVGEILRSARLANSNLTPPQIIQAAIQAKAMQMQAVSKNSSSSATATTMTGFSLSRSAASGTGTSGLVSQSQRLAAKMVPSNSKKLSGAPILTQEGGQPQLCEICDIQVPSRESFRLHIQAMHKLLMGKKATDMGQGATLACSRCRERFWTYEGLERHLVMAHGLVTADLLTKAQERTDGGKCKLCGKQYAFNLLQHLATDHSIKLCSAEIMYSCDVCSFKCSSYQKLEIHLTEKHPKN